MIKSLQKRLVKNATASEVSTDELLRIIEGYGRLTLFQSDHNDKWSARCELFVQAKGVTGTANHDGFMPTAREALIALVDVLKGMS